MPQLFQVLCCYNCEMFQVHQVKKSNKWQCRVCNEKQSLKKAFKIGASRDCRFLVQKLNMKKSGLVEEENEDLDICDNYSSTSGRENQTSELPDCTEKENSLNFLSEDNELDGAWLEEVDAKNNTRYYSNPVAKVCEESTAVDENDVLLENAKIEEISYFTSECCDSVNKNIENVNQHKLTDCEQIISEKIPKHPLDSQVSVSSRDVMPPPFKKHRGFQIIRNAASKLN